MIRAMMSVAILSLALLGSEALGQTSTAPANSAKAMSAEKQAVSKACSDQANAKGLHGKARKKFRSECRHRVESNRTPTNVVATAGRNAGWLFQNQTRNSAAGLH